MNTHTHNSIAAAIKAGTAHPDYVFNVWDVETILAGFARQIMDDATQSIGDSRDLSYLLGSIGDALTTAPHDYLLAEWKRITHREEIRDNTINGAPPELEDMPEDVIIKAGRALIDAGAMNYRAAALAVLHAFHAEPSDVLELGQDQQGEDTGAGRR